MEVARYRKLPVEIDAIQYTYDNADEVIKWVEENGGIPPQKYKNSLLIQTEEGTMEATFDDFIIRGIAGEFYPCKPEIFANSYEAL